MEEKKPLPSEGPPRPPHTPPVTALPPRVYEIDRKDRILLLLAWALGVLSVDLCFYQFGLGITVLTAAWYGVLFWYKGLKGFARWENRLLFGAVCLLALSFALNANRWLQWWSFFALLALMGLQCIGWSGAARLPWSAPAMLYERLGLLIEGLFCRLGAPVRALASIKGLSHKKSLYVLAGLALCIPLLIVVIPLLASADALFQYLAGSAIEWMFRHLAGWIFRLIGGLCAGAFLFGLLYFLRRPEPLKLAVRPNIPPVVEAAAPITVLTVMDVLYALFLAVQFAALFGGEAYLASAGISYAEYARSGFFQLVFVAVLDLALVLACLQLCKRDGGGWRAVQVLSTLLVAASVAMLLSAALRMSLYVGEYGLSFKRALTYWGMALLAVYFTAALLKIWRPSFSFFRVLFAAGVAGWLILNLANVDALVARYNVARNLSPQAVMSVCQTGDLSCQAALPTLEELAQRYPEDEELAHLIQSTRNSAAQVAAHWQSWSLTAFLAAQGGN